MPRGVYPRKPRPITPYTVRYLRAEDPRPEGEPRRFPGHKGYVRLRWKVGVRSYVELLEHRAVAATINDRQVHHKDHDPSNNDPSNLVEMTGEAHRALHGDERRTYDLDLVAELYAAGWSTVEIGRHLGVAHSGIYRGLQRAGVRTRTLGEAARLNRVDVDVDAIVNLHLEGRPAAWIARHLGTTREIVIRRIRSVGLTPHRPGRPEARRVA